MNGYPDDLKRYGPEANYLLHAIETRRVFFKSSRSEFMELKALYLRNVMSKPSKEIVGAMIQAGLVECDHHYIKGKKSMGYRLGKNLKDHEFSKTTVPKRIEKRLAKVTKTLLTLPVHVHLRSWLEQVRTDYEAGKRDLMRLSVDDGRNEVAISWDMIQDRSWWFTPDTYGRVHTNVTSLSCFLRQHLRVAGEPLVFVDIINSQPLFLSLVVKNYINNGNLKLVKKQSPQEGGEEGGGIRSLYDVPFCTSSQDIRHLEKLLCNFDLPQDVSKFNNLTQTGTLYEHLATLWDCSRDRAKKQFFTHLLFGKTYPSTYRDQFATEFPTVLAVLDQLKAKDYRHLAHALQRAESSVVIHSACETLRQHHPHIPLVTIHDSIGTTPEHLDTVRTVLADAFTPTGLTPTLRVEGYQS